MKNVCATKHRKLICLVLKIRSVRAEHFSKPALWVGTSVIFDRIVAYGGKKIVGAFVFLAISMTFLNERKKERPHMNQRHLIICAFINSTLSLHLFLAWKLSIN